MDKKGICVLSTGGTGGHGLRSPGSVVQTLQTAVKSGNYSDFKAYSELVNNRKEMVIRDLFDLHSNKKPIDINEVESVENIVKRFSNTNI